MLGVNNDCNINFSVNFIGKDNNDKCDVTQTEIWDQLDLRKRKLFNDIEDNNNNNIKN